MLVQTYFQQGLILGSRIKPTLRIVSHWESFECLNQARPIAFVIVSPLERVRTRTEVTVTACVTVRVDGHALAGCHGGEESGKEGAHVSSLQALGYSGKGCRGIGTDVPVRMTTSAG